MLYLRSKNTSKVIALRINLAIISLIKCMRVGETKERKISNPLFLSQFLYIANHHIEKCAQKKYGLKYYPVNDF